MGSLPGHSRAGRVPCSTQEPSLVSSLFLISGLPPPLAWAPPQAAPRDASLQGGAGRPQVPMQRRVGGRVPKADGQPPHQSSGVWPRPAPKRAGQGTPPRGAVAAGPARPRGPAQAGRQARAPSGPLCHPPGEARRLPWGVAAVSSLPAGLPGWAPEPTEGPLRPAAPRLGLMLLVRTWF